MIEIITSPVKMPALEKRRFQKSAKDKKWIITDTKTGQIRSIGTFENISLSCHNLNKKYYRDLKNRTDA